jgi:hypothetical protein
LLSPLLIGEKRIPCAAASSGIKGGCETIFSVDMSANAGDLRRLLYSKREKPVSSKNIFTRPPYQVCGKHHAQRWPARAN